MDESYSLAEKKTVKMDGKDDNGFKSCWKGYRKSGTKVKGNKEVNNCVKAEEVVVEGKGKCNHTGAGTSCPLHGDADCNSSKQNRSESTYSEALKGGQSKIDANHNGQIDGQDFKILRSKIGRAHVRTPVTRSSRMPSSA